MVYACVRLEEACRWKRKAGVRVRRSSLKRVTIPAAAGGLRASERPVGTPATLGDGVALEPACYLARASVTALGAVQVGTNELFDEDPFVV